MYLIHKFINFSLRRNCKIEFNLIHPEKLPVLNLINMSNVKSTKIMRGLSCQPAVQVLGSGAIGAPSNVLLVSGDIRYLINCGEGSQKLSSEYRVGLQKVSHIFITSPLWKNVSGLLGIALLNQNPNVQEFVIHGHNCIENIFSGINKFVTLRYNQPKIKMCKHYEEFSDGNISVKYVRLYSSCSRRSETPDTGESSGTSEFLSDAEEELYSDSEKLNFHTSKKNASGKKMSRKNQRRRSSSEVEKKSYNEDNFTTSNNKFVISYIFQTKTMIGALYFEKCVELGVPPGPLLKKLKNGENVTLDNGKLIKSSDVKEPDLPGTIIIVVECPSIDYLDSLLKEPIYSNYQSGKNIAGAVIHFSSSEVVKNPKYQEWISHFPRETKHLFLNEDNKLTGSVGIHRQQFKLNYLQSELFPLLQDGEIPDFPRAENCTTEEGHILLSDANSVFYEPLYSDPLFYKCESNSFINAETLCTLSLNSKSNYDYMKCLVLKKKEFLNEMFSNDARGEIEKCKEKLKELELTLKEDKRIYPKIVFLGTGSGKPSKVRNASGILIFMEENKCILFDCGENTYNQLVNFYGVKRVEEILRNLVAIYVSHLHVDHHLGLITILKERKLAIDKENELQLDKSNAGTTEEVNQSKFQPVYLLAPLQIRRWLYLYSEKFEDILGLFNIVPNSFLEEGSRNLMDSIETCKKHLNLSSLMTASVKHCPGSFGISITHADGWKITYSGDTRPCDALVKLGMESDILIHEATFEDAFAYEAKIKCHSTTGEAIEIGRRMNAKYILLTHFSQRYCYLPVIEDYLKNLKIGIAFDFMEVPFNKLPLLPALLEPLQYVFSEHDTRKKTELFHHLKRKKNNARNNFSEDNSFEKPEKAAKISKQIVL